MTKQISKVVVLLMLLAGSAAFAELPAYYPKDGFQRTGSLDGIDLGRQSIVINDAQYYLSNNAIVHSPTNFSVPFSRLRLGSVVGYKMAPNGRMVTELWILPDGYKSRRGRR